MEIDGHEYEATNDGGDLWMVKKIVRPQSNDDEADYVEALVHVDTKDERTAIEAAIKQGSWS